MTLRERYRKLDKSLIDGTQNAYLWALDRTGVYVASVQMAMYLLSGALITLKHGYMPWWMTIFLGLLGAFMAVKYLMQDHGKYDAFNYAAMTCEASGFRQFANGYFSTMIIVDLALRAPWDTGFDLILLMIGYVETIKVRERDKKPFFEKKEELVQEGAR